MELKAYKTRSIQGFNTDGTLDRARLDLLYSPHRPEYFLSSSPPRVDSGYNSPTLSPTAAELPTTTTMSLPLIRRALPKGGRKPHVCIVGAGVSGLRCADILLQAGLRVTVLEARNRVGGRRLMIFVEIVSGPNWIHGTEDNPILDLAKETGTISHNWDGRQCIFDPQGSPLPEKEAVEASETIWSIIGDGMEFSKQNSASIPASKSLLDYIHEKTKEVYTDEDSNHLPEVEKEKKRHLLHKIAEMWGAFVGSPIQQQSMRFFWLEECIDGENLFVAETYHKILDRIAKPAVEGADIKFGQYVKTVETIADAEGNENGAVQVRLADGNSMVFDEVVMTTPLGWLKRNKDTAFVPPLPERLSSAIDSIGYGCLDKVYITFPTAFWETSSPSSSSSSDSIPTAARQSVPNTTATTAPVHQPDQAVTADGSSNGSDPSHHPGFTQWTAPLYAHDTNPAGWSQECVNMAALPGSTAYPTLLFYTFGPTSQHIASILKEGSEKETNSSSSSSSSTTTTPPSISPPPNSPTHHKLLSFFAPYYTRLPGFDAANPHHQPSAVLATGWTNDELAGYGSYCNFPVGLERGAADVEAMRRGVPDRRVWLAGEHTASFLALGTVTGAYWSGEGVGRAVAWAYGCGGDGVKGGEEDGEAGVKV
ncbi:Lysine-specific histone demethylase 1-like protein 3 [Lasiodiplodia hormozganensis]|uniref:Lysine-specific histone demethylase 1-like protein 3 n=1 Tax=Lasiodiplodia hormozganensis TaxID=869390 RepID=A0AA40D1T2_9PEZI|nr:Lysine-specific histone demethylase 1-like protein 3 [Lasiodiplodia hormozganensis]